MSTLWIVIAAVTVGALLLLVVPLARRRGPAIERGEYDLTVFRDQLGEIDRDLERGLLDEAQAMAARTEIQRRMLAVSDATQGLDPNPTAPGKQRLGSSPDNMTNLITIAALAVLVPISALILYARLGSPNLPDQPLASRQAQIQQAQNKAGEMSTMVSRLAQRLKENPDSLEGWVLLGRSLATIERFKEAAEAFGRAAQLSGGEAEYLSTQAEMLVMAEDGSVSAEAVKIFEAVLAKDASDPRSYFYIGAGKAQEGNLKGALDIWVKLVTVSPADAPWLPEIRERIGLAAKELGVAPPQLSPLPRQAPAPASPPATAGAPGPSRQDMEAAAEMTAAERNQMIQGMVDRLAQKLKDNPNDKQGWLRLERAYRVLGDTAKADAAKAKSEALP